MSTHANRKSKPVDVFIADAMIRYGSYVNSDRAIPSYSDGLKPVQRRILWTMWKLGLLPNSNTTKSAKITGYTTANWHPHGDAACYGSLVSMVHQRYPLVEGQGNFGTFTDPPADQRYTEARLTQLGHMMFECLPVMEMTDNYLMDDREPISLRTRLPVLLMEGTQGIGIALSCCMPPHNLGDIARAARHLLKNPDATCADVLKYLVGPDYGYGVMTSTMTDIHEVYENGKGTIRYRCEYSTNQTRSGYRVVASSFTPGFSIKRLIAKCDALNQAGAKVAFVDETSDANGTRMVVDVDSDESLAQIEPLLHSFVKYEFYVVRDGKIVSEGILGLLRAYLDHLHNLEMDMLVFKRDEIQTELQRIGTLLRASKHLDKIVETLRRSQKPTKDVQEALSCHKWQAELICGSNMRVFSRKNVDKLKKQAGKLQKELCKVKDGIENVADVVEKTLKTLGKLADKRGTQWIGA